MKKFVPVLIAVVLGSLLSCGGPRTPDQAYHDYLMAIKNANGEKLYNLLTPEAQQRIDRLVVAKQSPSATADSGSGRKVLKESLEECSENPEFRDMTEHITDDLIKRLAPMGHVEGDRAEYPGALGEKAVFEKKNGEWRLQEEGSEPIIKQLEGIKDRNRDKNRESITE